jgi:hypothetical protein
MMIEVIVVRGTVDVPDPSALGEQRRLNLLSNGHAARTGQHIWRYWPGDTIELPAAEAARLIQLGICKRVDSP